MRHTPEPWEVHDDGEDGIWVEGPDPKASSVCEMLGRGDFATAYEEEDFANAERIVVCVNAMAGVPGHTLTAARPTNEQLLAFAVLRGDKAAALADCVMEGRKADEIRVGDAVWVDTARDPYLGTVTSFTARGWPVIDDRYDYPPERVAFVGRIPEGKNQ